MLARNDRIPAAEIAASVPKPARLVRLEEQIEQLRAKRKEMNAALSALRSTGNGHGNVDAKIQSACADVEKLDVDLGKVRNEARTLRQAHGVAVKAALAPRRRDLGEQVVGLIAELRAALEGIDESTTLIERASGECLRLPVPWLAAIEDTASRIAKGQ